MSIDQKQGGIAICDTLDEARDYAKSKLPLFSMPVTFNIFQHRDGNKFVVGSTRSWMHYRAKTGAIVDTLTKKDL
ncbi:MAG: hypothetical protein F6K48_02910 [Okeania sp. SIO3H1]|nr:hypothetical protein [Okeania sp. SIO3H1]